MVKKPYSNLLVPCISGRATSFLSNFCFFRVNVGFIKMIDQTLKFLFALSRPLKRSIQATTDTAIIVIAFALAMALRLDSFTFAENPNTWAVLLAVIPVTLLAFVKLGHYRAVIRFVSTKAIRVIAVGSVISALTMLLSSQVFGLPIPRSVPIIYFAMLLIFTGGIRYGMRMLHVSMRKDGRKAVAIYGAGESGRQLLNALAQSLEYKPVLFIDDNPRLENVDVAGLTVLPFARTRELLEDLDIKAILLAMPSVSKSVRRNITEQLERLPVEVKTLPGMSDLIEGKATLSELRDVSIEELLGRDPVTPKPELMSKNIEGKAVLVTGAGGSIGSELCRQIVQQRPSKLILLDLSEFALYSIHQELEEVLSKANNGISLIPIICSVLNENRISDVLESFKVDTIYHAAAYKHVPLVEMNVAEGVHNNVFGTLTLARAAIKADVEAFILISTDKAVRPTNFMGASKRLAELVCQAYADSQSGTKFSMVRFGNVLGSSGSVIPRFKKQIGAGGPITVTHREINRFFMTIPEAAQLVIQAGSMAKGGDVFVLDMGDPIKIIDLAQKMVRLHGLDPYLETDGDTTGDILIQVTGLRPGEKLFEELLIGNSPQKTEHERIMRAHETRLTLDELSILLDELFLAISEQDIARLKSLVISAPAGFQPGDGLNDLIWSANLVQNSPQAKQPELRIVGSETN